MENTRSYKKHIKSTLKNIVDENSQIEICLENIEVNVEVNDDVYDNEDAENIKNIVKKMSKQIYIDRTYVDFNGNRWKDAFIVEDKWDDLCKLIIKYMFNSNRKVPKRVNEYISESLMTLAVFYLYGVIKKFGYNIETINIEPKVDGAFSAKYRIDNRKTWNS